MRKISLALVALSAAAVLYGCSEQKGPAVTKGAGAPAAAGVSEPPAAQTQAAAAPAPEAETVVEKKVQEAPAPAKAVREEPSKAVKEVAGEQVAAVRDVSAGMALYKAKCSPCHGPEGKGTMMAPALKGNDWVKASSSGAISEVILKGRQGKGKKYENFFNDMPPTSGVAEGDVSAIIDYLKSLN